MLRHPLLDPTAAGIRAGKGHDERTAVLLEQSGDLGSAHLRIVDRIGYELTPIIGDAKSLSSVAPGFRSDLHQPNRLGRRHVALVEATFGANDRLDDAPVEVWTDMGVKRHADVWKSVLI